MAKSLLLDVKTWGLVLDASGNIACATDPYALAQNVASAALTQLGECYYDTSLGIPYVAEIFGQTPPLSVVQAHIERATMSVYGVVSCRVVVTAAKGRIFSASIYFTDATGIENNVNI